MKHPKLHRGLRNRISSILFFILLSAGIGTASFWISGSPSSHTPIAPITQLAEPPCEDQITAPASPSDTCPETITTAAEAQPFASLSEEIAFLNQAKSLTFDNSFRDGFSAPMASKAKLEKTKNGYVLHLQNQSFLATPTFDNGHIYTSAGFNARSFYAIDAATGKVEWAVDLSDDGPSSPLVTDSLLIFNTESCTIFALDRFTGRQVWAKWIGDPLLSHPATDGKRIYTAYPSMTICTQPEKTARFKRIKPSHAFAAMDVQTGKVIWQRWLDGDVMTSPVLEGESIYLTTFAGTIYQLSKADGKILHAATLKATSLPSIGKDKIYTTQRRIVKGKVCEAIISLDKHNLKGLKTIAIHDAPYLDGKKQAKSNLKGSSIGLDALNGFFEMPAQSGWNSADKLIGLSNVSSLQNFVGSTVVLDTANLYTCMGDSIHCYTLSSGAKRWSYQIEGDLLAEGGHLGTLPMVMEKYVLSTTLDGKVLILDKHSGRLVKGYATHAEVRNQPIVVRGKIYVPTMDGDLICINTHNKNLCGWTMFLGNNAHNMGQGM